MSAHKLDIAPAQIPRKVLITPEISEELLLSNTSNRPLNKIHVKTLADEMLNGRWKVNGATISVSNRGVILDGQHRLHACILSSTPFWTYIIEGLDPGVFDTIDTGRKRRAGDMLSMLGKKNAHMLAATLVFVDQYMTGTILQRRPYTNSKVEELLDKYEGAEDSVGFCVKYGTKGLIPPSIFAGCHYLFSRKDREMADSFCNSLIKGADIQAGDPVYLLRERLIQNMMNKAKLNKPHITALTIKAWNHTRKGGALRNLRWRTTGDKAEDFPLVR